MSQIHDAAIGACHHSAAEQRPFGRAMLDAMYSRIRTLITDGLTADAFLVLDGEGPVAVLLRRDGSYLVVARREELSGLDGQSFQESHLALHAIRRVVTTPVTLSPVWYS